MRWTNNFTFAMAAAGTLSVAAIAGQGQPVAKTVRGGESGLVGIKLYDTGARVISVYGNPTEIQPVSFGGQAIGPAGGPAGGPGGMGGGPSGAPVAGGRGGGGTTAPMPGIGSIGGFGFGDELLFQGKLGSAQGGESSGIALPGGGDDRGGAGGGRPGMGGPAMGGGAGEKVVYTRWIYKRGPSKYGFIIDKFNRVVQVEAIGMNDPKVRTSKGVRFGSTFADIIKKYQTPDGYEISGNQIVVRYLVRNKVAFRLSQLQDKKPHVVTGIVVAGGKT